MKFEELFIVEIYHMGLTHMVGEESLGRDPRFDLLCSPLYWEKRKSINNSNYNNLLCYWFSKFDLLPNKLLNKMLDSELKFLASFFHVFYVIALWSQGNK